MPGGQTSTTSYNILTLYNVCAVPWGVLSTVGGVQYRGDIMSTVGVFSTVGVILSTVGDVQYRGGYHDARGGYHEYRGGYHPLKFEYRGGIS